MKTNICICFFIILSALACHGAKFDLGPYGVLSVSVPSGWIVNGGPATRPDGSAIGYAFSFGPTGNMHAKCLLTFAYVTNPAPDKAMVRKEVVRITKQLVARSVEKKQNLKDFSLEKGYGAYCVFTDASLVGKKTPPGEYKVIGSGEIQLNEKVMGVVSLFVDDANGKDFEAMIKIINSLKLNKKGAK